MSNQRRFTTEYKEEIIKLVTEQGRKVTPVARDIGVSEATVRGDFVMTMPVPNPFSHH